MRESKPVFPGLVLALILRISKSWLFWIFWIDVLVFIYKGIELPYHSEYLGFEISFLVSWGIITFFRIQVGTRAVARFQPLSFYLFIICTIFALIINCYLLFLQAYSLRIELILNSFCLGVEALEAILALASALMYGKQQTV